MKEESLDNIQPTIGAISPGSAIRPCGVPSAMALNCSSRLNLNTVKLGLDDRCGGWSGGLGPFRMVGAFRGPFEDFAFDDSGVGALPAHRVEAHEELCDGA